MKILTAKYLQEYIHQTNILKQDIEFFLNASKTLDFTYLTESSSVYSSNIEGNTLNLNTFMNARMNRNKPKDTLEIENLIAAYTYAQNNILNEKNFLASHELASKTLLIKSKQWVYRNDKIWVFGSSWLIYLAIESEFINSKMNYLFDDITELLSKKLTESEVFYYASLIHLMFVHVHPFTDGNGRLARILEKWFLSSILGIEFWKISSEQFYKENRNEYYKNINLWVNYYELDYSRCLPFLLMLPKSLMLR